MMRPYPCCRSIFGVVAAILVTPAWGVSKVRHPGPCHVATPTAAPGCRIWLSSSAGPQDRSPYPRPGPGTWRCSSFWPGGPRRIWSWNAFCSLIGKMAQGRLHLQFHLRGFLATILTSLERGRLPMNSTPSGGVQMIEAAVIDAPASASRSPTVAPPSTAEVPPHAETQDGSAHDPMAAEAGSAGRSMASYVLCSVAPGLCSVKACASFNVKLGLASVSTRRQASGQVEHVDQIESV